ncbi:MAG: uracil-DNA glycosylase [Nitrospira sp.]|nr:uracil-DNA glycosylase [Nitrospira sp.]
MTPSEFVDTVSDLKFQDAFNPYADRCPVHDTPRAPTIRAKVLKRMLEAAVEVEIDALWIGRDLGYRGGRRTGLALTDDIHIQAHAARWSISAERPTSGEVVAERTAAVIWGVLSKIDARIFLWNVFPLHPHEPRDPFTNRSHNSLERSAGEEVLRHLIGLLKPRRLIAIGNDAAYAACRVSDVGDIVQVRHPSYGGQVQFLRQIRSLYGLA